MSTIFYLFGSIAIFLYSWASIRLGRRLFLNPKAIVDKRFPITIGIGAATLHGLVLFSTTPVASGLNLSFFNALSLLTWFIAGLLLFAAIYKPVENLAIVLLPLAGLSLLFSMIFPSSNLVIDDKTIGLDIHIITSILAFALLNIAAIQALLLAVQNQHLRNKHPGGFIRGLPPLQTMEELLFQMIGIGFILQTLSLMSGFVFLEDMFAQHLVHKTALSIIAWLVFAILLWGRWQYGWRGRTAIRWTLSGFASLFLAYIGSKLVLELLLGR